MAGVRGRLVKPPRVERAFGIADGDHLSGSPDFPIVLHRFTDWLSESPALDSARRMRTKGGKMPEKKTIERAREDAREGKAPSTQAGEFVREEIHHVREGKHGVKNTKQAIAIGLSKARKAGVKLPRAPKGTVSAEKESRSHRSSRRSRPSAKRSRAGTKALKREGRSAASHRALSKQAKSAARRRTRASRSRAARKAARTRASSRSRR
jgi:uncharacterized protein DUF6496